MYDDLLRQMPNNLEDCKELVETCFNVGAAFMDARGFERAHEYFERGSNMATTIYIVEPDGRNSRDLFIDSFVHTANMCLAQGDAAKADEWLGYCKEHMDRMKRRGAFLSESIEMFYDFLSEHLNEK